MTSSLIITTYNWKAALELVLLSVFQQQMLPDEILIADDGSTNDTRELIQKMKVNAPLPLLHLWQEDQGFRASSIRNKAIAKAGGDYIILVDGDMILHREFIHDHLAMAKINCFSQGSRVLLSAERSKILMTTQCLSVGVFDRKIRNRKNAIHSNWLTKLSQRKTISIKGIRTCNFAFWKKDAILVNGFNEDFVGWGREDSEFAARLINAHVFRQNIKFNAIAYHLWHSENDRSRVSQNDELLATTIQTKSSYCKNGLSQYLS